MELLLYTGLTLAVVHGFYWLVVRPVLLDRVRFNLCELRDILVEASLTKREGVGTQAFHEAMQRARLCVDGFEFSCLLYPLYMAIRSREVDTEVKRRELVMQSAPAWILSLDAARNRMLLLAAVVNSPFTLMFLSPFLILAVGSRKFIGRVKAIAFVLETNSKQGPKSSGGSMLAHA